LPIRQMEVNKEISKIKSDNKMPEADKKAKIAELQKRFDELGEKIAKLLN
jgi:ribosome recycling factor